MKTKLDSKSFKQLDHPFTQNKNKMAKSEDLIKVGAKLAQKATTLPKKFKIHQYPIF